MRYFKIICRLSILIIISLLTKHEVSDILCIALINSCRKLEFITWSRNDTFVNLLAVFKTLFSLCVVLRVKFKTVLKLVLFSQFFAELQRLFYGARSAGTVRMTIKRCKNKLKFSVK
jgi:hypothetical protein